MLTGVTDEMLIQYLNQIKTNDEVLDKNGHVKPIWEKLFQNLNKIGLSELANRSQEIKNKLSENGVTYNIYNNQDSTNRSWKLDAIPFLIQEKEWDLISAGLKQRAVLLDEIYKDFYGQQRLIKEGVFPAHVIYGNDGFQAACFDAKLPSKNQLIVYAADLARGPDQKMWILDGRTQSPSGSGYALENRSILSRIMPELSVGVEPKKISPYFTGFQHAITKLAHGNNRTPNVVYLTPGPDTETFFEHTYLASYFGYTLVHGDDLLVRDSQVFLKSVSGLEKVDVIIRRVDDEYCDPLELREDSRLGVPGLLQAIRTGNVIVANPPGSAILENHALLPFMANACRFILGEDLLIPNIATWWCGHAKELNYVIQNLPKLIIKKANRKERHGSVYARLLNNAELEFLKQSILANPKDYVAQEEYSLSTTPSFVDGNIVPRLSATRAFLVSDGKSYQVMKGGLTRSSADSEKFIISNQLGGISKDTWIVGDQNKKEKEKIVFNSDKFIKSEATLASRSAESLFWTGRYCERSLSITKFARIIFNALQDDSAYENVEEEEHMAVLVKALTMLTFIRYEETEPRNLTETYRLLHQTVSERKEPGSIRSVLSGFLRNVTSVNDKWNHDTRRYIAAIENSMHELANIHIDTPNATLKSLSRVQRRLFAFYGTLAETFPRDTAFYMLEGGKYIERILNQISVIRSCFNTKYELNVEKELIESILINHNLLVYYRQLYKSFINLETTLDMIILDERLPYSLSYMLGKLYDYLSKLPQNKFGDRLSPVLKLVLEAHTKIRLTKLDDLAVYNEDTHYLFNLDNLMSEVYGLIGQVTDELSKEYFTHTVIHHSLMQYPDMNNTQSNEV